MALTPQALVEIVAGCLQLPVSTVRNFDRRLMESGLRTKKGHGRGSAIMTASDAANLLISLAATGELRQVATCVKRTRELPICGTPEGAEGSYSEDEELIQLASVIGCTLDALASFGTALDAVMNFLVQNPGQKGLFTFSVDSVGGSSLTAAIIITHQTSDGLKMIEFRGGGTVDRYIANALRVKRYVSGTVLSHIASEIGVGRHPGDVR